MHSTRKIAVLAIVAIIATGTASAQRTWTVTGQEVPELAAIDEVIRHEMVQHDISASSLAITKDGRLIYARGYTWDQPGVAPVQPTSLFRTGSIAKSITSIAIHQLIEQGLLAAGHDRSDGGVIATLCEMAFAARCSACLRLLPPAVVRKPSASTRQATSKCRLWASPETNSVAYSGRSKPRDWRISCSRVFESLSSASAGRD